MNRIREITARVAAAVLKEAVKEDLAAGYRHVDLEELQQMIQDDVSN
jgi:malate dehydrogenase (decarboxylating)